MKIKLKDIHADYILNCRDNIDEQSVSSLAENIKIMGLLQPLVVKKRFDNDSFHVDTNKPYFLLAGFRRFKAVSKLGYEEVECTVLEKNLTHIDIICINLAENAQRADLSLKEATNVIGNLYSLGLQTSKICEKLNLSRSYVAPKIMLYLLPDSILQYAESKLINLTDVKQIYDVYKKEGIASCLLEADRLMQVKKSKNSKVISTVEDKNKVVNLMPFKSLRTLKEIRKMINHWYDHFVDKGISPGVPAAFLSWVAGEISTEEVFVRLKSFADENELSYRIPTAFDMEFM